MRNSCVLFFGLVMVSGWFDAGVGAVSKPPAATKTVYRNLPEKAGFQAVAVRGKIYAFRFVDDDARDGKLGGGEVYAYDPQTGRWEARAKAPLARSGYRLVVANDRIFVMGGITGSGDPASAVEEYVPAANAWVRKQDMPTARTRIGAVVLDGRIYALGGAIRGGVHTDAVEVYDPATDSWSVRRKLSRPLIGVKAVAAHGKIYKLSGVDRRNGRWDYVMAFEEYDPPRDAWTKKAPWSGEAGPLDMAVVDGRLFVFGGDAYAAGGAHTLREYDFRTDRWAIRSDMPAASARTVHPSWCVADGRIYVFGGGFRRNNGWKASDRALRYDPQRDAWEELPPLAESKIGMPAVPIGNRIFILGGELMGPSGQGPGPFSGSVEVYKAATNPRTSA